MTVVVSLLLRKPIRCYNSPIVSTAVMIRQIFAPLDVKPAVAAVVEDMTGHARRIDDTGLTAPFNFSLCKTPAAFPPFASSASR